MGRGRNITTVWRHLAVALAYALGFVLLREISISHWVLFSGFRLCALLLVPTRYWPALLAGELGVLGCSGMANGARFGWLWSALYVIPPVGLSMPVVRWCRGRLRLFPGPRAVNMAVLLLCTLLVSLLWTLLDLAVVAAARLPPDYSPLHFDVLAARWFIGNFLGILTVVPLALLAREYSGTAPWRTLVRDMTASRVFLDTVSILLPSLGLLVWLALASGSATIRQAAGAAMFLPVVWLSLRHGWHGAALGGTLASVAVVLTMPARYDTGTLQAQVFIAFAITTMLLLGERIAALNLSESRRRDDARLALALAQRNMMLGEMQLRQTSQALEQLREAVQSTYGQMLEKLRHAVPALDERAYRQRAALTEQQIFRLADSLHPTLWRDEGLAAALRRGSIGRALEEAGIRYWCEVREAGLDSLSSELQIAMYRIVCDAIEGAGNGRDIADIIVHVRAGSWRGLPWVVLRIDSMARPSFRRPRPEPDLGLSASGLGLTAIRDRVSLFHGRVRCRKMPAGERLSVILHDRTDMPFRH